MPNPNSTLQFYLNGETVVIENPSPSALLVDYLRSPEVRLTGTKKPCGQGGCGGCTVILSDWPSGHVRSRAINSCLRRLCSLNGMAITTIEGTGGLPTDIAAYPAHHPTASRFAPPFNAPLPLNLLEEVKTAGADVSPDGSHVNPVAYSLATNNGSGGVALSWDRVRVWHRVSLHALINVVICRHVALALERSWR